MTENREILKGLGLKYGSEVTQPPASKGWKADPNSNFLKYLEDKYYRVEGKKPIVKAIHAGLECGHFSGMDPDLKVVSIGPTIEHAHSPEESVQVNSVLVVWNLLRNVVESMWQLQTQ
jgi:dipeptidase D